MDLVRHYIPLLKTTYTEWDRHQAPKLGAALAYYTVLALAPLLIVVIAVVGIVLGREKSSLEAVDLIAQPVALFHQSRIVVDQPGMSARFPCIGAIVIAWANSNVCEGSCSCRHPGWCAGL